MVDVKLLDFLDKMLYNIEAMEYWIRRLKQKIGNLREISSAKNVKSSEIVDEWLDLIDADSHFRMFFREYDSVFETANKYARVAYGRNEVGLWLRQKRK